MDASYGNAMSPDDELRNRCRAMYQAAATICGEIGAVTEIEYQYGPQDPMPLFDPYQQLEPGQEDSFTAFYRQVLDRWSRAPGPGAARADQPVRKPLPQPHRRQHPHHRRGRASERRALPDTFHMSIEEADMGKALIRGGRPHRARSPR